MASKTSRNGEPITGINITPLVDITLVLLIIFMVTAKLIVSNRSLNVDLPKAASRDTVQEIFSLALLPSGVIQVNGRDVDGDDELVELARRARAAHRDLRAVIQADGSVPHRRVMHVLDLLRQAGVSKIGFAVVPQRLPTKS
jgi:biopolymer transport protein ExbD